jgi:DNA-binding transcriptional LysR family regulator
MARHLVIPALPDFLAQHPALQLMLSSTDRRVDLVREGFDCVVRVGALEPSSLVARPLGHYRQINCASAGYLAATGAPHPWGSGGPPAGALWFRGCRGAASPALNTWRKMATAPCCPWRGPSWSMTARPTWRRRWRGLASSRCRGWESNPCSRGELVSILPQWQPPPLPIHALYAHRRQLAPRVQLFIHWLAGLLAAHLGESEAAAP